jgi:hypothetical protein
MIGGTKEEIAEIFQPKRAKGTWDD